MTAGMRLARNIVNQPALSDYVAAELVPGKDVNTDAEFEAAIRRNGISNLHPVGTCRMGTDEAAVLDPRLRVRGIGRLRVVDASVMPSVPAGNTDAVDHDRRKRLRHDPRRRPCGRLTRALGWREAR